MAAFLFFFWGGGGGSSVFFSLARFVSPSGFFLFISLVSIFHIGYFPQMYGTSWLFSYPQE